MAEWSQAYSVYRDDDVSIYTAMRDRRGNDPRAGLLWCCKSCYMEKKGFKLNTRQESIDGRVAHFAKWPGVYEKGNFYGCVKVSLSQTKRESIDYAHYYILMESFFSEACKSNAHGIKDFSSYNKVESNIDFTIFFVDGFPLKSINLLIIDENKRRKKNLFNEIGKNRKHYDRLGMIDKYNLEYILNPSLILEISEFTKEQLDDFKRVGVELFLEHLEFFVEKVNSHKRKTREIEEKKKVLLEAQEIEKLNFRNQILHIIKNFQNEVQSLVVTLNELANNDTKHAGFNGWDGSAYLKFLENTSFGFNGLTKGGYLFAFDEKRPPSDEDLFHFFRLIDMLCELNQISSPKEKYSFSKLLTIFESIPDNMLYSQKILAIRQSHSNDQSPLNKFLVSQFQRYIEGFFLYHEISLVDDEFLRKYNDESFKIWFNIDHAFSKLPKELPDSAWKFDDRLFWKLEDFLLYFDRMNREKLIIYNRLMDPMIKSLFDNIEIDYYIKGCIFKLRENQMFPQEELTKIFPVVNINPIDDVISSLKIAQFLAMKSYPPFCWDLTFLSREVNLYRELNNYFHKINSDIAKQLNNYQSFGNFLYELNSFEQEVFDDPEGQKNRDKNIEKLIL